MREADALFARAERQISLLARVRATNEESALTEWLEAYRRGARRPLRFLHPAPPELSRLRRALEEAAGRLAELGALGALYAARAEELELEARLAEQVGRASFFELARRRYAAGSDAPDREARALALEWAALPEPSAAAPELGSDDRRAPDSLISQLATEIGRRRLPLRIELAPALCSVAACGEGVIFVRPGARLSARAARRVVLHELLGHALPRLAARGERLGLLRAGTARANDDEEGRALHIEERHDALDDVRRRELGWRHLAALDVASGATPEECVEGLGRFGCPLERAATLHARVARGGGLCRELVYIPGWLRFRAALAAEPSVTAWLARGRTSLEAARVLSGLLE